MKNVTEKLSIFTSRSHFIEPSYSKEGFFDKELKLLRLLFFVVVGFFPMNQMELEIKTGLFVHFLVCLPLLLISALA